MKKNRFKFSSYIIPFPINYVFNIRNYISYPKFITSLVTLLFFLGGAYYAFFHTPRYEAVGLLNTQIYGSLSAMASMRNHELPVLKEKNAAPREMQILQSYDLLSRVATSINIPSLNVMNLGEKVQYLKDSLVFTSPGSNEYQHTNVISVQMTGMEPSELSSIVNTLMTLAVEESKEREKEDSRLALKLMRNEQKNISSLISEKEKSLADSAIVSNNLSLASDISDQYYSQALLELDKNIAKAEGEVSLLGASVTEISPRMVTAKNVLNGYLTQKASLMQTVKQRLNNSDILQNLKRDINVYTLLYEDISKNIEQFQAREQAPIGDIAILQYASVPDNPISYSIPTILLLSLLVGLISGYVVALASD